MDQQEDDKIKKPPIDVAVILSIGMLVAVVAALIGAWVYGDTALASDLAKNFLGPGLLLVLGFYFGASRTGKDKNEVIALLSEIVNKQGGGNGSK